MKILIAGHGDTAIHLAKMLSREKQDVVVMGTDSAVLSELDAHYNVITTVGSAVSRDALVAAGAGSCDLFIAVTPFENHNLISCEIAKWLGGATTLARIDNAELLKDDLCEHFRSLGVDRMVYPEYLASKEICDTLAHSAYRSIHSIAGGLLEVMSLKLPADAPIAGISLAEFGRRTSNFHISMIKRRGEVIIPQGGTMLERGDVVYVTSTPGHEEELAQLFGKTDRAIGQVIVAGAGKIAAMLARNYSRADRLKFIDPDRERCLKLSAKAPEATIVCADFRDIDVLREEGIRESAAFVALGDSSETNIVAAIMARDAGALKTVAQIEDIQYFDEAQSLDIDTVVNKKLLTSSHIYQLLLDSYLDSPRCLAFEDTEVVEIVASERSHITSRRIRDLHLSRDMTIAGLTRGDSGMLVGGDTRIEPGDHVVVFCQRGTLKKVERLFV